MGSHGPGYLGVAGALCVLHQRTQDGHQREYHGASRLRLHLASSTLRDTTESP
jgi:hypothetical protein